MAETCGYTGAGALTRVALYRPPEAVHAGVLLVPGVGDERRSLIRTEVELARAVCRRGFLAARFDPAGDSDSPVAAGERTLAALQADFENAAALLADVTRLYALSLRAGAVLLAAVPLAGRIAGVLLVAPVSGAGFTRELTQRHGLRRMLTGSSDGDSSDIDGVPYRADFLAEFAAERVPDASGLPVAAVQIGPARDATAATRQALAPWLAAGAVPALPPELPAGISASSEAAVAVWRHPVLWGQTEYSDASALVQFALSTLSVWEQQNAGATQETGR